LKRGQILPRIVIATSGVDEDFSVYDSAAIAVGQKFVERNAGDFCGGVPNGHI
jgi:hypothetical protein